MEYIDFVTMLENERPFHFVRYGDGEWRVIFGDPGFNCDGHNYKIPGLQEDMIRTIKVHKTYFYGMQGLASKLFPKRIEAFLEGLFIPWIDADIFHDASRNGNLNPFISALKNKRVCFVGPKHLTTPNTFMSSLSCRPGNLCIFVPDKNCYLAKSEIYRRIETVADEMQVFVFSAGFLSKILIWELHSFLKPNWLIDVGSLWDPYCGINSRRYHYTIPEAFKKANFA